MLFLQQLIQVYEERKSSVIGVQEISGKEIESYGVVSGKQNHGIIDINALVEKPKYEEAPSKYGIIGKYVCNYEVLAAISSGQKSADGELRLIDGFKNLLWNKKAICAKVIEGDRYDTGSKEGWLRANIAFARKQGMDV